MEKFRKVIYFDQCSGPNSSAILPRGIIKTLKCSRKSVAFLLLLSVLLAVGEDQVGELPPPTGRECGLDNAWLMSWVLSLNFCQVVLSLSCFWQYFIFDCLSSATVHTAPSNVFSYKVPKPEPPSTVVSSLFNPAQKQLQLCAEAYSSLNIYLFKILL